MRRFGAALLVCLVLAGCAETERAPPAAPRPAAPPPLSAVAWTDLPGWDAADAAPALAAFKGVCSRFQRKPAGEPVSKAWPELGSAGAWSAACARASGVAPAQARAFVEANFRPLRVGAESDRGLFTGYFEPEIPGARRRGGPYQTPLYVKPKDIVVADLGAFSDELAGKTLIGKVDGGRFEPYDDRAAIAAGSLAGRGLELVWLADPIDGFFLEIQGSGRIRLAEGGAMRVGYAGKNGRAYRAIGRDLIERGAVRREDMSMQAIRSWLATHPDQAQDVMNLNRSVVFFVERTGPGPVGAAGTALTPGASLAVDPDFVALGSLLYLDAPHPDAASPPIRRLVVAEDTGGAIKGANRGDLFWGTGAAAGEFAGRMASRGRYYLLAPKGG